MADPTQLWGNANLDFSAPLAIEAQTSANGNELSVVFTNYQLQFNQGTGPTSLTQIVSICAPITVSSSQQLIGYLQQLEYGITRTPGVRVLIVADLAGTLKTIEYGYDVATAPGQDDPLLTKSVFSLQGLESSSAALLGLTGPVANYVATITVTIQRRTLQETAAVQIDGLDVSAALSSPPASPSPPTA